MSNNSLPLRSDGQTIDSNWFNVFRTAAILDQFPRDSNGVVTDQAGSLGSSSTRFLNAYLMKLYMMNGARAISLSAPGGMVTDYDLVLPSGLPASTLPMQVSSSGIITFAQVATTGIADDAVTMDKLFNRQTTTGGAATAQNNISVSSFISTSHVGTSTKTLIATGGSLTCSGSRAVFVGLGCINGPHIAQIEGRTFSGETEVFLSRSNNGGADTDIYSGKLFYDTSMGSTIRYPASSIWTIDTSAPSGSNVYKLKLQNANTSVSWEVRAHLIAFEMA